MVGLYVSYGHERKAAVAVESYRPLLDLIGRVESNGNYDAHYGNASNSDLRFTEMKIEDVMKWQQSFVEAGNASSAVGRYQIIDSTLQSLVKEMNLNTSQKFDQPTQDAMAIALLERRGSVEYVNDEVKKEEFAANLAKEWAALPKVTGENPDQSYYAGDGLNKSRASVDEVIDAIEPISPKQ